jgi:hypothetical protein
MLKVIVKRKKVVMRAEFSCLYFGGFGFEMRLG